MSDTSTPNTPLHGLNTLRALAILSVLGFHYMRFFEHPAWLKPLVGFGWTGVDLFFVLSGYLITSQLLRELSSEGSLSFKRFYIKRSFRILPPFLAILLIYACVPWAREKEALAPLYRYLTFTQNIGLDVVNHGTFSHAWSLCIEEQFYLVLPIILCALTAWKLNHRLPMFLVFLACAGLAVRGLSWNFLVSPHMTTASSGMAAWQKWIYYPTQCRLDGLLVGVLIAWIFECKPVLRDWLTKRHILCLLCSFVALVLAAGSFVLGGLSLFPSVLAFPMISVSYGFLVIAAISPGCWLFRWNASAIRWIATLSYSVYLSHKIVIHLAQNALGALGLPKDGNAVMLLCLAASFAFGYLMHLVIERPSFKLRTIALSKP